MGDRRRGVPLRSLTVDGARVCTVNEGVARIQWRRDWLCEERVRQPAAADSTLGRLLKTLLCRRRKLEPVSQGEG